MSQKSYFSATIVHTEIICSVCICVQYTDILFRYTHRATQKTASIHTTHKGKNDTTNGGLPPSVLSNVPFVCGVNAGGLLCGTCVYLNNMSVYCTHIHTLHMISVWTIVAEKYDF